MAPSRALLRRLRWPAAMVLVAGAALGVWRARGRVQAAPRAAPAAEAPEVLGIGLLESSREVPAAFEASGRISALLVDEGDRVVAGQVLGTIDPPTPRRKLAVAQATLLLAKASAGRAEADLERARVGRASASRELLRVDQLIKGGASTPAQRDEAADRVALAEAELRAAGAAVEQARESEHAARESVQLQQQGLVDTRLVSPMDAVVVKRQREAGHYVAAGTPVFTLASTSKLWVRAWVDETALSALRPGQGARIEFRAEPGRAYAGRIDRIGRQADRQLHEVLVDVEVLEVPAKYAFGQRADVHLPAGEPRLARAP